MESNLFLPTPFTFLSSSGPCMLGEQRWVGIFFTFPRQIRPAGLHSLINQVPMCWVNIAEFFASLINQVLQCLLNRRGGLWPQAQVNLGLQACSHVQRTLTTSSEYDTFPSIVGERSEGCGWPCLKVSGSWRTWKQVIGIELKKKL